MTDKVKQWIWAYDKETNKKSRMHLQRFIKAVNDHCMCDVYFALEKDRNTFAKQYRKDKKEWQRKTY